LRIATWNVNSLGARIEKVWWWLERARPDVLLMQETKLADADAPREAFAARGYELAHHGEGQWNGVAIASRVGIAEVVPGFGGEADEARMIAATCGGVRVVSLYAPNGRTLDSVHYRAKLEWYARLARWIGDACDPATALVLGGDFNVAPTDADVWDPAACHGGTHLPVSY
jgi:exodeoxyribonuclease-3